MCVWIHSHVCGTMVWAQFKITFSNRPRISMYVLYKTHEFSNKQILCWSTVKCFILFILEKKVSDCIISLGEFLRGGPQVCPPDYKESDDNVFWIYFLLRFLGTTMLSGGVTMMGKVLIFSKNLKLQYSSLFAFEDPIALTMVNITE